MHIINTIKTNFSFYNDEATARRLAVGLENSGAEQTCSFFFTRTGLHKKIKNLSGTGLSDDDFFFKYRKFLLLLE